MYCQPVMPRGGRFLPTLLLVLALAACGAGEKPEALLASARDYLAKNDAKSAIIQAKNALQKNPDLPEGRYLLGLALLRDGDAAGGEAELRKAIALGQPGMTVAVPLAQALLAQRQYKKVSDEFSDTVLPQAADQASLQTALASAYAAQGKTEQSREAMGTALRADPNNAAALLFEARDKATKRDFDGALAIVESVIARAPANHEAWRLKGEVLWRGKGDAAAALLAYRKAIGIKPDYVAAHGDVVGLLVGQGNFDDAAKQLELLVKLAPNNVQTKYFEALLAYRRKDLKLAREAAQQLVKLAPGHAPSLQLAGAIELDQDSLALAEAYLAKAVEIAPQQLAARRLLVNTYLRSGQNARALAVLQPALKNDNVDAATNALAGRVYLQNGDAGTAESYFAKVAKQDPKNTRARTALALTHVASGQGDAALNELQEVAASDSGTTADLALISVQLRQKEYDKALKAIDALEKKQPDKPLAANLRGRTLLAKRDLEGARKSFERSVALSPTYFPSVASLAAMDMAEKKPDEARKRFEAVLAQDPRNAQALLALAQLAARTGGSKEQVTELVVRAVAANPTEKSLRLVLVDMYLRNKDPKAALSAAQNAVAALPDSYELLDALGQAQQASGDMNQAIIAFNKAAVMQPLSPQPQMRLAQAYVIAKDSSAAAGSLRKALKIKPDLLDAQRGLVVLAVERKDFTEAQAIAKTVQKQRPKEPAGYLLEGDVAANQQKWDAAIEVFRAGLKQVVSPELATKLHAALGASGKTAERDRFDAAWLKDHPKDTVFRLYLGDAATARGDYAAAEKIYANVIQIQPANAIGLNNLAWVSGKLKREGAIALAEKAVALDPSQPGYMDTLAMLLSGQNNYAKALEWQNKAVALQPQVGVFRLNLAKIHIQGGNKDLARKELDELAKLGDKFRGQAEVAELLKSL